MTAYESALAAIAARRELIAAGTPRPWEVSSVGDFVGFREPAGFFRLFERRNWSVSADAHLTVAATNAFAADTDALEAVLLRHAPRMAGSRGPFCFACHTVTVASAPHWPCPDAQAALTALGIDPNGDTP